MGEPWVRRLRDNWQAELDSASLYEALAACERDPLRRQLYQELAAGEQAHAEFWAQQLRASGRALPARRCSLRTRVLIALTRHCGTAFVLPSVIVREMRDRDEYLGQGDARVAGLAAEEHGHAQRLRSRAPGPYGNNLRAAVLGANDGLASNFCLLMAVAGGGTSGAGILLTGLAGLVSGACSMALGEWLSVTNARELAVSQLDRAPGGTPAPQPAGELGSARDAASAAAFSFGLFALGAAIPVLPFCLLRGVWGIAGSIALSLLALFALGVATSLFNARSALFSGARQVLIGCGAAALTYGIGRLLGALLAGAR